MLKWSKNSSSSELLGTSNFIEHSHFLEKKCSPSSSSKFLLVKEMKEIKAQLVNSTLEQV